MTFPIKNNNSNNRKKRKNGIEDREKKLDSELFLQRSKACLLLFTYYYLFYPAVNHISFYRNKIIGIALSCLLSTVSGNHKALPLSTVSGNHKALPQSLPEMSEKNETTETEILKKSGRKK